MNEARLAFSGHSSPLSTKANSEFPDESTFNFLVSETVQSKFFDPTQKKSMKKPENPNCTLQFNPKRTDSDSSADELICQFMNSETGRPDLAVEIKKQIKQIYSKKFVELFEFLQMQVKNLQNELYRYSELIDLVSLNLIRRKEGKLFKSANEKIEEIKAVLKDRKECDILIKGLSTNEGIGKINDAGKALLNKTYGKYFLKIVEKYQNTIKDQNPPSHLDTLLDFLLIDRDKARVLRFISESDYESAACVIKNSLITSILENKKLNH